jgi:hypothetical protein
LRAAAAKSRREQTSKKGNGYLQFEISAIQNYFIYYKYRDNNEMHSTAVPESYYYNYGKIEFVINNNSFIVYGHNLDRANTLLKEFTGKQGKQIRKANN